MSDENTVRVTGRTRVTVTDTVKASPRQPLRPNPTVPTSGLTPAGLYFALCALFASLEAALCLHAGLPIIAALTVLGSIPLYCFTVALVWEALEARS